MSILPEVCVGVMGHMVLVTRRRAVKQASNCQKVFY